MSENTGTAIAETDEQKKCLKRLGGTVEHNMVVHKLMDSIVNLGCKLPEEFLSCRKCGPHMSGGFLLPQQGKEDSYVPKVVLCNNDNIDFISFNNTIIHELIHAYDACRAKVDWKNCSHIACTEIRAAALRDLVKMTYRTPWSDATMIRPLLMLLGSVLSGFYLLLYI